MRGTSRVVEMPSFVDTNLTAGRIGAVLLGLLAFSTGAFAGECEAGAATVEITPPIGFPMWGYAVRKDAPCEGVLDPLMARALVLKVGEKKLALVSIDLGRSPTRESMARIREALRPLQLAELFVVASHTHHGPVVELENWPRGGKPYVQGLEEKLCALVRKADAARQPARYGVSSVEVPFNRNRQSRRADAPVDREMLVLRVETRDGKPLAHAVNFAAHPTMLPARSMKFSADFPGSLAKTVEMATGAPCLFLQGAAGDLSPNPPPQAHTPSAFGEYVGQAVLKAASGIRCDATPAVKARIVADREMFHFAAQVDPNNYFARIALERAFFPELIGFFRKEYADGVRPTLSVAFVDSETAFVGVSGELFCGHALSLKRRARIPYLFVLGYCNDYQQYFPTIESVAEGGYGTTPPVATAEIGAGEKIMNRALLALYRLRGQIPEAQGTK